MASSLKLRSVIAVGGLLTGLAGVIIFGGGLALFLSRYTGMASAVAIIGFLFLVLSVSSIWLSVKPSTPVGEEVSKATNSALQKLKSQDLDAATGLPISAASTLVRQRPLTALAGVAVTSFIIARAPKETLSSLNRLLSRVT